MQEEDGRSEETPADSSSRRSATPAASESSRSIAASQGVSSHSYFLAPYLPTSRSASTNNAVESSIEMSSQASQGGGSDLAGTRRRLSSKQSQAIQERRQAALEELCLGTDGVPVHRGMLHQFTGLVKRIFDSKLSMVSLVRDEIEMVGVERYKTGNHKFPPKATMCTKMVNSQSQALVFRDIDKTEDKIRNLPVWQKLSQTTGTGLDESSQSVSPVKFYAAVPLVVRCPSGSEDDEDVAPAGLLQKQQDESDWSNARASEFGHIYHPFPSKNVNLGASNVVTLGTLCIMDTEPRAGFNDHDEETLRQLGDLLVRLICAEQSEGYANDEVGAYQTVINFLNKTILSDKSTFAYEDVEDEPTGKLCDPQPQTIDTETTAREAAPGTPIGTRDVPDSTAGTPKAIEEGGMVIPDNVEEKRLESELYDDAICAICEVVDDCAVVLLDVSQYRIYLRREPGEKDDLIQSFVDADESLMHPSFEVQPLVRQMPGSLRSVNKDDLIIKRVRRDREDGQHVGPKRLAAKQADILFSSPFNDDEDVFSDGVGKLIQSMILKDQYWYHVDTPGPKSSSADEVDIIKNVAPAAKSMLALPVWHTDGSPLKVLVMAWNHVPSRRKDLEKFARGIVSGTSAAMMIRKAKIMAKAQAMFSSVQAHELRTPIHQIKNIATLVKSSLTEGCSDSQQYQQLMAAMKDIEMASQRLEMVTNNVLSYFEVQSSADGPSEKSQQARESLAAQQHHATRSLEIMFTDLIEAMVSTDMAARQQQDESAPPPEIEIILEIVPPFLGETVEEDSEGNLARAVGNIISNALAFIDKPQGYVHIVVDDIPSLLPPQGYSDLALTKNISIQVQDSGIGMDRDFLQYHYFRPLKKENDLKPGSGLSVHIAQRLLNMLGGNIAVSSQTGSGTTVVIEVPLKRRRMVQAVTAGVYPRDPDTVASDIREDQDGKKVYISGFFSQNHGIGLKRAGEAVARSLKRFGCQVVKDPKEADLVLKNVPEGVKVDYEKIQQRSPQAEIILLYCTEERRQEVEPQAREFGLRCFKRPLVPSVLRDVLFKEKEQIVERQKNKDGQDPSSPGMEVPKAKPSSASSATSSNGQAEGSSQHKVSNGDATSPSTANHGRRQSKGGSSSPRKLAVLVVEDNSINRKILVQFLKKNWRVEQAVDGRHAVEVFKSIEDPCVVLLDINMPKMNGFDAAIEMRSIEKNEGRVRSQIVAVTALSSEEHRSRGLIDCGMDSWLVKPTNRKQIWDAVEEASVKIAS